MQIITLQHKLDEKWFADIESLQDEVLSMQPCIAFMALTYPEGNTGYFLATASSDKYSCTTIGKQAYEAVLGAIFA